MSIFAACSVDDCTTVKPAREMYFLRIEQPDKFDRDAIARSFCEEHIADFEELLPGVSYVDPEEVTA